MRTLQGSDRIKVGLLGLLILLMVIGVGQSFASVPMLFARPMYYAHFADAAGATAGDKVRISGMDVGQIKSLKIEGDRVRVRVGGGQRDAQLAAELDLENFKGILERRYSTLATQTLGVATAAEIDVPKVKAGKK